MMPNNEPRQEHYLTVVQVADRLRCSEKHVRRLIKNGDLMCHRFGSLVRIAWADLQAFEAMRRTPAMPKKKGPLSFPDR